MASAKREATGIDGPEPESKKTKVTGWSGSNYALPPSNSNRSVFLNPADCDIDFNIEGNGLLGSALYEGGFSYCWSGARANVGITGGKYCFGCKIISSQPVDMEDTPRDQQHVCRVGISTGDDSVGNLGETAHSFGFGGTGKFSNLGKFFEYGEKFGVGDTIICAVDLENKPMASIGFYKNGKWLGMAKHFDAGPRGLGVVNTPIKRLQWTSSLFPHVLLKNVVVQLQFSTGDGLVPEEGYKPWASAIEDGNTILGPGFSGSNSEVIMMVGLPASGKTTWAEKWVKEHPEKRYVLLGTNLALEQMKVPGLLRKNNYGERFERLMERATGIFNALLSRASTIPRNFIIDQTNVYKSARKRKLKPFIYLRKIAIVVFPRPEELKLRADKRFKEMGKAVPAEAVNNMLANYVLPLSKDMPGTDEYFDEVLFVELNRAQSQICLDEMKRDMNGKQDVSPYSQPSSQLHCSGSYQYRHETSSVQSHTGFSFQNQSSLSGTGGHWNNSYSSRPPSGAPCGNYYSSPSVYDSSRDVDHKGSYSVYDCARINVPAITVPIHGGDGKVCQSYGVNSADIRAGVESRGFIHWAITDPSRNSINECHPKKSSTYDAFHGYAIGSRGPPPNPSITSRPADQFSAPSPYGPYQTTIAEPPYGNFPVCAGVHSPPLMPPPRGNFPIDAPQRPGVHPPGPPPHPGYY